MPMTPDAGGRLEPWPRPWQRDYADPTLPSRVCLYKDSRGTIFTCEAGEGYPDIYVPESELTRLRAEVEALVPLAQAGLAAFDYAMAKEQYGTAILPRLDRVAIAESLTAARALLAARKGEG